MSLNTFLRSIIFLICLSGLFSWTTASAQKQVSGETQRDSLTLWVFISLDCPISQKYIHELRRIDSLYTSIRVKAVIPGNVSSTDIANFWQEYNIDFEAIPDPQFTLVNLLAAKTTPEVFLAGRENRIYYRGAIDNWFFDLGKYRQRITRYYLADAIEAVGQHRNPKIKETEAVGCPIQVRPSLKAKK